MKELTYPFDPSYILSKKRSLKRKLCETPSSVHKKIAILSGVTVGEVKNILELFLLNYGISSEFWEGEYGRFYEDIVFDNASLTSFEPDFIYFHTSMRNIQNWPVFSDDDSIIEQKLKTETARFFTAYDAALKYGCPVIINNFELPSYRVLGNKDGSDIHGRVNYIHRLNSEISHYVRTHANCYLHDLNYLQALHGIEHFSDQTSWYAYKYCCSVSCIPYLSDSLAKIIKSLLGKNKKALALDLDNTLWGGVVGDDGPEGLEIGNETPTAMAYTEFQSYLKSLSQIGILLNVDSKNEEVNALAGLKRPECVLHRDDFLCFKANWEPKHLNLVAMAKELNILTDSFVFVDDNPAEREIVMRELPEVSVPELSSPEEYISVLDRKGYFEVTVLSEDDKKRSDMYKQNIMRLEEQNSFGNYDDYLLSLSMIGEFGHFDDAHSERITQLINKTNQFNFTTRRYTPAEVQTIMESDKYITLYGRLKDKFGDNGITSALIAGIDGSTATIDLWVMSCRVFKRNFEFAMLDVLIKKCREKGIRELRGIYRPTAKNLILADFYDKIGFSLTEATEDGERYYSFLIPDNFEPLCNVMKIELLQN